MSWIVHRPVVRLALAVLLAGAACGAWAADNGAFELVTPAEAVEEARAAAQLPAETHTARPATRSLGPTIDVLAPSLDGNAVQAPLRIELAFRPAPGARIVPSTFRALYGVLKIDLTERLTRVASITEGGFVVDKAQVPDGQHRFVLRVNDDRGNVAEQELRVRVGPRP
jgi:hypothetical protein